MDYRICFPTPLTEIDPANDNLDVCVRTDDGRDYTFVITTPENLKAMMDREEVPYLRPGLPMLIAAELTEDVITRLIREIMADEELARLYGCDI